MTTIAKTMATKVDDEYDREERGGKHPHRSDAGMQENRQHGRRRDGQSRRVLALLPRQSTEHQQCYELRDDQRQARPPASEHQAHAEDHGRGERHGSEHEPEDRGRMRVTIRQRIDDRKGESQGDSGHEIQPHHARTVTDGLSCQRRPRDWRVAGPIGCG